MDDLYHGDCCHHHFEDKAPEHSFTFSEDIISGALKRIYEQKFNPEEEIDEKLLRETWRIIDAAASTGASEVDYKPATTFLKELKMNNAVFSAFKVHRMQNDIAAQMIDGKGELKPFSAFARDVQPITDHQCRQWLKTEYDTAVRRAHDAVQWKEFEQHADLFPNLEWMPSTAAHPDAIHATFVGTILPKDHPFWSQHQPGDHWGCQCTLQETDEPSNEAPVATPEQDPLPGLDNNPGKDAKLFSDTHPYFTEAYPGAEEAVSKIMDKLKVKVEPRHDQDSQYSERTKEIKKEAASLKKGTFENKKFDRKIHITGRGIKEWLNQPHVHYAHKNELLLKIDDVISKAKYLGYGEDKRDNTVKAHLFEIKILGDKSWIIVREMADGTTNLHSISDSDNILNLLKNETE